MHLADAATLGIRVPVLAGSRPRSVHVRMFCGNIEKIQLENSHLIRQQIRERALFSSIAATRHTSRQAFSAALSLCFRHPRDGCPDTPNDVDAVLADRAGAADKDGWGVVLPVRCWLSHNQPMARPAPIRERFTIGISPDGAEVQRPLAEMTTAEVLAAMAWHTSEAERLEREAAPARPVAEALVETGAVPDGVTLQMLRHYSGLLQRVQVANQRLERLSVLIRDALPAGAASDVGLSAAVRRFWRPP